MILLFVIHLAFLKVKLKAKWKLYCKNKIVTITNLLVSAVARNSGNCHLIGCVSCYDGMVTYM